MNPSGRHFILGLTTLIAILGMVVLLMLFGEMESLVRSRYGMTIECPNAEGLRIGSTVELNGVPVGRIDDVTYAADLEYPVRILAMIDDTVLIADDVVPYATVQLLGGSATLQLEAGPGGDGTLPTDGSAVLHEPIHSRLMEEFGNIRTAVETLNQVLDDVRGALAMAKTWLGDDELRTDARIAVRNAKILIEQATDTMEQFAKLAGRIEADSESVSKHLAPVLDELASTLEEVHGLVALATVGEGTVAQLLNNPDLYKSLHDAAIRLERTLREVQLLVEKVKADGLPAIY